MADDGEHKAAYERLKAEFEDFLFYLPDGFIEADIASQRLTRLNRSACLLLGYDPAAPPVGIPGPSILVEGEFERLYAYHLELIRPSLEQGVPYQRTATQDLLEVRMRRRDSSEFPAEFQGAYVLDERGLPVAIRFIFRDITERKAAETERVERLEQLERLLPICAWCNRIRDEGGDWQQLESYIHRHAGYDFTHSICPDCERRMDLPPGSSPGRPA
ncbi:MAG: PAS domain-containing protein [Dehalococcoidia bacterium]